MNILHKLTLDLQKKGELQRMDVVQGDAGTRHAELTLLSGGEPWEIPEQAQLAVRYLKPDGTSGVYDRLPDGAPGLSFDGNIITLELAPQMLTCAGAVQVQVELSCQEQRIATFAFLIAVEQAVAMDGESGDYVNWTRMYLPQTSGAAQGQYLQIAHVDEAGRVLDLVPVEDPSAEASQQIAVLENHLLSVGQRVEDASVDAADAMRLASKAVIRPGIGQVGQALVVKAVDSNGLPTEWETVDLPEGNSGGNTSRFRHSITTEEALTAVSLDLPTEWKNVLMFNLHIIFGELPSNFNLYSYIDNKFISWGSVAAGSNVGVNIYGLRYSGEHFATSFTQHASYHEVAMPGSTSKNMSAPNEEISINFYSATEGVAMPAGTTFEIWGVYAV